MLASVLAVGIVVAIATVLYPESEEHGAPGASGRAEPHVLPFAQPSMESGAASMSQPATRVPSVPSAQGAKPTSTTGRPPAPSAAVPVPANNDGCDHTYGERNQCVPWNFPDRVADGCQWLRERGFGSLRVHGRDRHGLDRNGDGIACGDGD
ncbi:hypothetical protein GCM10012275_29760 [Longimycelium tulufanense]|uniref:Excalibur calcium-binding domain-containing protein n=2 Tax=Longimycelium tulufanense TaxID=907463 RepID=A0A8J3CET0_9PSEU|nr:hypothetical protein GCM10012275_29760 [Longimycelium tulufanense]